MKRRITSRKRMTSRIKRKSRITRRIWLPLLVVVAAVGGCGERKASRESGPRVVVIGIDGMDFRMAGRLMRDGRLPNLSKLAAEGSFIPIQSSMPPLSPVAWSNFITGMNPGGHGVFDFVRREISNGGMTPADALSRTTESGGGRRIPFTHYVWPTASKTELLRDGKALWQVLESAGIKTTVYKMPANFPAAPGGGRSLSGMGTPDIEGSYGTFTYFSDRLADAHRTITGGRLLKARISDGALRVLEGKREAGPTLDGPMNPFAAKSEPEEQRRTKAAFDVFVDRQSRSAVVHLQGREILLREGEWGEWLPVEFELVPHLKSVSGQVRFYLAEASPGFRLYASPVNLAPGAAGLATGGFDRYLEQSLGPYFTKGMSEETKAIAQGLFTADEYVGQSERVLKDSLDAMDLLTERRESRFLFVYISTLDLNSHVLWKDQDPAHPAYDKNEAAAHARDIEDLYVRLDGAVGKARATMKPGDILYVMSDHGFVPMYREFNLVSWLEREGYLFFNGGAATGSFSDIDWHRTRAYGIGFQSLYLNLQGREPNGIVQPAERPALLKELREKLLAYRDSGQRLHNHPVIYSVYRAEEIYSGPHVAQSPDLILGYAIGYGPSDDAVLGVGTNEVLADHLRGFSGHHTTDPVAVPGVLFSTKKLTADGARLEDVTVTVLEDFGVSPLSGMIGRAIQHGR